MICTLPGHLNRSRLMANQERELKETKQNNKIKRGGGGSSELVTHLVNYLGFKK